MAKDIGTLRRLTARGHERSPHALLNFATDNLTRLGNFAGAVIGWRHRAFCMAASFFNTSLLKRRVRCSIAAALSAREAAGIVIRAARSDLPSVVFSQAG